MCLNARLRDNRAVQGDICGKVYGFRRGSDDDLGPRV